MLEFLTFLKSSLCSKEMVQWYSYMKKKMESVNTAYKQMWTVKVLPRNIKRTCLCHKTLQNLAGIYRFEDIPLTQA